jgi:hypothetical protein
MRSMLVFLLSLLCTFVAARGLTGQRIGAAGIGVAGVGDIVAGVGDIGVANVGDIGVGVHIGTNPMWGVYGARRCGTHAPWPSQHAFFLTDTLSPRSTQTLIVSASAISIHPSRRFSIVRVSFRHE